MATSGCRSGSWMTRLQMPPDNRAQPESARWAMGWQWVCSSVCGWVCGLGSVSPLPVGLCLLLCLLLCWSLCWSLCSLARLVYRHFGRGVGGQPGKCLCGCLRRHNCCRCGGGRCGRRKVEIVDYFCQRCCHSQAKAMQCGWHYRGSRQIASPRRALPRLCGR